MQMCLCVCVWCWVHVCACVPMYTLSEKLSGGVGHGSAMTGARCFTSLFQLQTGSLEALLHGHLDRILLNVDSFKICPLTLSQRPCN